MTSQRTIGPIGVIGSTKSGYGGLHRLEIFCPIIVIRLAVDLQWLGH